MNDFERVGNIFNKSQKYHPKTNRLIVRSLRTGQLRFTENDNSRPDIGGSQFELIPIIAQLSTNRKLSFH
jgi:hypothetical protein